ncbi:lysophospholipid acyltransferase family protein [Maricaulis sp. D1M11]|uniref:lysophospholipid acyltransferase family protein n=1 Tax=Maricaulis sp. D1M11 TaxID=3076117 RepID=UPI0039B49EC8
MRSFVFNALFWGISALFAIVCYALSWLPWRRPLVGGMIVYCKSVRGLLHTVAGIPIEVRGTPPKNQSVIIAAKHQSYADGPLMMAITGDINFVIGNGIEKFPLINRIVRRSGATMVNAQGETRAIGALQAAIARSHGENRPLLIYPEGGLTAVGQSQRYRLGVAHMYEQLGRPVVPAATNMGLRWQQEDWQKQPGPAVIEFLPVIEPGLPRETFLARLADQIETRTRALEAEGQASEETQT